MHIQYICTYTKVEREIISCYHTHVPPLVGLAHDDHQNLPTNYHAIPHRNIKILDVTHKALRAQPTNLTIYALTTLSSSLEALSGVPTDPPTHNSGVGRYSMAVSKNPRLQDRLRPDSTIKISYSDEGEDPRFIVGYWSIRGLGAPIRMMLSAAQVNHWIALYDVVEDGEKGWSKETWLQDKEWIKKGYNPLANLPYLIDCRTNMVLVQSNAIMSFLGRELRMLGRSPPMTCRCEELLCEIMDLRNYMVEYAYDRHVDRRKEDAGLLVTADGPVSRILDKLETVLENAYPGALDGSDEIQDKRDSICFLVGNQMTAPDFCLWEILDQFRLLCSLFRLPSVMETRPYLDAFFFNFRDLEENDPYLQFDEVYNNLPLNNPYARFGSDPGSHDHYLRDETPTKWRELGVVKDERVRTRRSKRSKTVHSQQSQSSRSI